jgi:hypothetical protein
LELSSATGQLNRLLAQPRPLRLHGDPRNTGGYFVDAGPRRNHPLCASDAEVIIRVPLALPHIMATLGENVG